MRTNIYGRIYFSVLTLSIIGFVLLIMTISITGCTLNPVVHDNVTPNDINNTVNTGLCGNNICDNKQERRTCPDDCAPSSCGDGICAGRDTVNNCPEDCESSSTNNVCGNKICEKDESSISCIDDCPINTGNTGNENSNDGTSNGVTFTTLSKCSAQGKGFCKDFTVTCDGALSGESITKKGSIIVNMPSSTPKGTIFLMTGGGGNVAYHLDSPQQASILNYLIDNDFRVVEITWSMIDNGVIFYPEPVGAVNLFCAPASVFLAFEDLYGIDGPVCAQGNSGGSMQLAYPLTFYDTENLFDMVILTGGPPTASFTEGCQGYPRSDYGFMPGKNLGPTFIDQVSGYGTSAATSGKDYCSQAFKQKISIYDYPDIVEMFDKQSLVVNQGTSKNSEGDYDYPNMYLFFVESRDDESNANNIGRLYYDLVSAKDKSFTEVSGIGVDNGGHNVPSTVEGAAKIKELFIEYCK